MYILLIRLLRLSKVGRYSVSNFIKMNDSISFGNVVGIFAKRFCNYILTYRKSIILIYKRLGILLTIYTYVQSRLYFLKGDLMFSCFEFIVENGQLFGGTPSGKSKPRAPRDYVR